MIWLPSRSRSCLSRLSKKAPSSSFSSRVGRDLPKTRSRRFLSSRPELTKKSKMLSTSQRSLTPISTLPASRSSSARIPA